MNRMDWIRIVFSVVGAFDCAAVVAIFGTSQPGGLWPLPGLYFSELILLGLAGLVAAYQDKPGNPAIWGSVPWAVSGALLAFVVLGGFSIGLLLIPAMLLFAGSGVLADRQYKRSFAAHVLGWAATAVFQAGVIFWINSMFDS